MITSIILTLLVITVGVLGWLVFALHVRLQKMDKTQAIMLEWFDGIQKNEETLQDDIKKIFYEFKSIGKEIGKKSRITPKT